MSPNDYDSSEISSLDAYNRVGMRFRRISTYVTIGLGVLALILWLQGWWNGARPNGAWFSTHISHVSYPLWCGVASAGCACVGWILLTVMELQAVGEPRCRKCGYVLHGLSEPRCPECGEPI